MNEIKRMLFIKMAEEKLIVPQYCTMQEIEQFKKSPESIPDDVVVMDDSSFDEDDSADEDNSLDSERYARYPECAIPEMQALIAIHNAKNIKAIKNCIVFFTVLTAASIAVGSIAALVLLGGG